MFKALKTQTLNNGLTGFVSAAGFIITVKRIAAASKYLPSNLICMFVFLYVQT